MNDGRAVIWLTESHPLSGRSVVLEDNGESCWLYLCERESHQIVRSVLAYSPMAPASVQRDIASGQTPVLTRDFASAEAVIIDRYPDDFSFRWRPDGGAVALLYRDEIRAVASVDETYGSSKAIARPGPFGSPLVPERHSWATLS